MKIKVLKYKKLKTKNKMTKVYYLAELSLPNTSAYAQHVLKMCDNLSKYYDTTLILINNNSSFTKLKKDYLLKKKFKIISLSKYRNSNFFKRIILGIKTKNIISGDSLVISRSIISALILSLFKKKCFLEIHHGLNGLTNVFFKLLKNTKYFNYIYFIIINKKLLSILGLKKNFVILDDAVEIKDFKGIKAKKIKYQFTYAGSLYPGKGIEIIENLSKKFKHYKFHIFGDYSNLDIFKYKKTKNLVFHGFISYKMLIKVLKESKYLLMPYLNQISANSKNLEISEFISPLKLFQYLAARKVIFASKLVAYNHILKNKFNCVLNAADNIREWENNLRNLKKINNKRLSDNAYKTAKIYTWEKRVKKIIRIFNERRFNVY
mgnify:CR=1 FL=1